MGAHGSLLVVEGDCAPSYLGVWLALLGAYTLLGLPMAELSGQCLWSPTASRTAGHARTRRSPSSPTGVEQAVAQAAGSLMNPVTTTRGRSAGVGRVGAIALPGLRYVMDLTVLNLAVPHLSADLAPQRPAAVDRVAPGYTDQSIAQAGGNPYGTAYASAGGPPGSDVLAVARHQGRRLAAIAELIASGERGERVAA